MYPRVLGAAACVCWLLLTAAPVTAAATEDTVVSLTFDDGHVDQLAAARALHAQQLPATFYVPTGAIGSPGALTRAQLQGLAHDGDEIGADTVSHLNLTGVSPAEARRQACDARARLTSWGLSVSSLAYPAGATNPAIEHVAADCGYTSARTAANPPTARDCAHCDTAEQLPPRDPFAVRTPGNVTDAWTLADLEHAVLAARAAGGGWVPLVFHHVCSGRPNQCGTLSIRADLLCRFTSWLADQQRSGALAVRTVSQVVGGEPGPARSATPAARHGIVDPSLEKPAPSAVTDLDTEAPDERSPRCWQHAGYGANDARWRQTKGGHTGGAAERVDITNYRTGDAKLVPRFDLGECSLPARAGATYQLGAWYRSSTRVPFIVYVRDAAGRWRYWTSSRGFAPSAGWAHARWSTPPVPADTRGVSFGLALPSAGSLTTDDYSFGNAPDPQWHSAFGTRLGAGIGIGVVLVAGVGVFLAVRGRRARARRA